MTVGLGGKSGDEKREVEGEKGQRRTPLPVMQDISTSVEHSTKPLDYSTLI